MESDFPKIKLKVIIVHVFVLNVVVYINVKVMKIQKEEKLNLIILIM